MTTPSTENSVSQGKTECKAERNRGGRVDLSDVGLGGKVSGNPD